MHQALVAVASLAAFASVASARAQQPKLAQVAVRYVEAQQAVMQRGAGTREADALLAFYTDDYTYYHPQYGAKVTGLEANRRGIESHLGETADARITIDGLLVKGDLVTLSTETRFTIVSDRQVVARSGIWVLTFRDGKIAQRVDVTP